MNVALIAPRLPPALDGVGDHAHALALALARRGDRVTAFTAGPAREAGYPVKSFGRSWDAAATARCCRFLQALRPDLVLMEYTPFLFGARSFAPVAIGTVARMLGIPCRTIAHEIFYTRESEAVGSAAKERFFALRDRAVLANAESIFVANDERRERIVAHLPHAGARIREVAIGANVEPPPGYRRTPPEDGRIELVTFGVVMPRRRYEVAIEALAALRSAGRDARLTIVGRIFDRVYAERCRVLARSLGVERSISFAGARDASDISAIFAAGSLALSTTREGSVASSGSLLALLAHGMPILAVRGEQSDPRFADAVAYCEPAPSALAAAISGLIDRGTAELGERAVQAYRRDFDWNAIAAAMTSFGTGEERHGRVA